MYPPSFSANPIVAGGVSTVTAFAWDDESGIDSGAMSVADRPPEPMVWSGSTFTAQVGLSLPAGLYPISIRVRDVAGNEATTDPQTLVVYDPTAGSVSGTGWIVPDPSAGDELPAIDGKAKGSFSFTARYKTSAATTPSGSFIFTYGNLFKLQSDELDWLVVTAGDAAYIQGTASIRGDGSYPFRVTIRDGRVTGSPDYLLLEVCACITFEETGPDHLPGFRRGWGADPDPTLSSAGSSPDGDSPKLARGKLARSWRSSRSSRSSWGRRSSSTRSA